MIVPRCGATGGQFGAMLETHDTDLLIGLDGVLIAAVGTKRAAQQVCKTIGPERIELHRFLFRLLRHPFTTSDMWVCIANSAQQNSN